MHYKHLLGPQNGDDDQEVNQALFHKKLGIIRI